MSLVVGIIPARYASTRFPGKPLHLLAGKPLIQHVWERAGLAKKLDRVIIATDDIRIAEAAFAFGAEVTLTSDKHPSGTDRLAEIARHLKSGTHFVNIQGDEPLIAPSLIDHLVRELQRKGAAPIVTAASPILDAADFANPNVVKVVLNSKGCALYFSRAPIPFDRDARALLPALRHHGIYAYTRAALLSFVRWKPGVLEQTEQLEQLRVLENGLAIGVVQTDEVTIGVDTPEDAIRVEQMLTFKGKSKRKKP